MTYLSKWSDIDRQILLFRLLCGGFFDNQTLRNPRLLITTSSHLCRNHRFTAKNLIKLNKTNTFGKFGNAFEKYTHILHCVYTVCLNTWNYVFEIFRIKTNVFFFLLAHFTFFPIKLLRAKSKIFTIFWHKQFINSGICFIFYFGLSIVYIIKSERISRE